MSRWFYAALVMVSFVGCSVKEDREACPCRLVLDLAKVDSSLVRSLNLLAVMDGHVVLSDRIDAEDFGRDYVNDLPHGDVRISIWGGGEGYLPEDQGLVIPYGCECPPIYMQSFMADTRGESYGCQVDLGKSQCRLTIQMDGVERIPYSLTFKGNVDGYRTDGYPSSGDFACVAYPGDLGESVALMPRQLDSSLILEVDDGTAVPKVFAVGEHIAASGYDWSEKNLKDVTVILDYYITYMRIMVQGWDKEYVYDIIL